ncbi:MAG: CoA pyrophosphatase [Rheinheimera sp.]|nr:CoA pyrophosphatase [Rheinheimera sp.]
MHNNWLSTLTLRPQQHDAILEAQVNAAVLLPVWYAEGQWQLLLTRRALHLRHHPGQISFPGGRLEAGETALVAAKREAFEEVGIQPQLITDSRIALPALSTSTGFVVKPWLAVLAQAPELKLQTSEVASSLYHPTLLCVKPR